VAVMIGSEVLCSFLPDFLLTDYCDATFFATGLTKLRPVSLPNVL